MLVRPLTEEYPAYYVPYVGLVPDGNLEEILQQQQTDTCALFSKLSGKEADYRYAPEKWMTKEVLGHITDTERIMSYRLLRVLRGDKTPLAGFDEGEYMKNAPFHHWSVSDLLDNYTAVRQSTLVLLHGVDAKDWMRKGIANNMDVSARAIAYIIAGHERHHAQIVRERYLAM